MFSKGFCIMPGRRRAQSAGSFRRVYRAVSQEYVEYYQDDERKANATEKFSMNCRICAFRETPRKNYISPQEGWLQPLSNYTWAWETDYTARGYSSRGLSVLARGACSIVKVRTGNTVSLYHPYSAGWPCKLSSIAVIGLLEII